MSVALPWYRPNSVNFVGNLMEWWAIQLLCNQPVLGTNCFPGVIITLFPNMLHHSSLSVIVTVWMCNQGKVNFGPVVHISLYRYYGEGGYNQKLPHVNSNQSKYQIDITGRRTYLKNSDNRSIYIFCGALNLMQVFPVIALEWVCPRKYTHATINVYIKVPTWSLLKPTLRTLCGY